MVATPDDGRTIPALDAKTCVTMQQILSTIWQRSKAHKNGLFVRVVCPIPIQTVIVDNEGIDVRKLDGFF